MKTYDKSLHKYTLGEELINAISHGIGALLAVIGSVFLIIKALPLGLTPIISVVIYCVSMLLMYSVSTVYHSLARGSGKKVMRILDHCFVYVLIIGTYAPLTLAGIKGSVGLTVFLIVLISGIVGITLTAIDMHKFAKFAFICYLAMGWTVIFAIKPLIAALPPYSLTMLILGGVAYTLGALLYLAGKKLKYIHSVWHFFVLLGTVLHYFSIINGIIV